MSDTTAMISLEAKPAVLSINFDELKAHLQEHVSQYDIVVTADTVADAKKLATDLNKQRLELEAKRKEAVAKVSEPIKEFEGQMKELAELYQQGRQKILNQVEKFEDETRELARELLTKAREKQWKELLVKDEFRKAEFEDLIKLTAVTKAGNLSASAANELKSRVQADRDLQNRTRMRLMELENRSYKAGLAAPLSREHVEPILFADDQAYEAGIEKILTVELARQEAVEARARQRMEQERRAEEERQRRIKEDQERAQQREQDAQRSPATEPPTRNETRPVAEGAGMGQDAERDEGPIPRTVDELVRSEDPAPYQNPPEPAPAGKVAWSVHCEFRLECSSKISQQAIEAELRRVLEKAGITTLQSVQAIRQQEAA